MHPNTAKRTNSSVSRPMGWIGCVHCEKLWCDFVARNFALIALVLPISQQVSCSNETIQNAPKHYKTHQYMCLGFNGVDRVRSLRKFLCDFMARNFALIALVRPVLHRVLWCNKTVPNAPKWYKIHQNMSLGSNGVDRARSLPTILMRLHGMNFWISCTSSARSAPSFM